MLLLELSKYHSGFIMDGKGFFLFAFVVRKGTEIFSMALVLWCEGNHLNVYSREAVKTQQFAGGQPSKALAFDAAGS